MQALKVRDAAKYEEGDCFAVPLSSGGYATCLLARIAPGGRVLFGYFFGPRRTESGDVNLELLSRSDAILTARFGDLGIVDGSWRRLGTRLSFRRDEWPMPVFVRQTPIERQWIEVHYRDENPNSRPLERPISADRAAALPRDGLLGAVAVSRVLDSILSQGSRHDA